MAAYASGTLVSVEKSKGEIERLLVRYGATRFAAGWDGRGATILFEAHERRVRFLLPIPHVNDPAFERDGRNHKRSPGERRAAQEQEERRRWRALALVIKAKLEAVESGVSSFEEEFLAHICLPSGGTVGEWAHVQLEAVYRAGKMPPLLPGATVEGSE